MSKEIRVSYGSAVELGLLEGRLGAYPRTAYLFLSGGNCRGKCAFCPQSDGRQSDRVSRVGWPKFPLDSVLKSLASASRIERVCIQCSDEEGVREDIIPLARSVAGRARIPISVSMAPAGEKLIQGMKEAGVERLTIPLDCASERLFYEVKGRRLEDCLGALGEGVRVFGRGMVGTHIIVGLGETERDVVTMVSRIWEIGVRPSLFAFTPMRGTPLEGSKPPEVLSYRRLQLATHMILELGANPGEFSFDSNGKLTSYPLTSQEVSALVKGGTPFETSGCPGCNRPYFNERASGPLYNFPRPLLRQEIEAIEADMVELSQAH